MHSMVRRQGSRLEYGGAASSTMNLSFMNSLGEPDASAINRKDILSAMAFNATGKLLAVGDHAGRCIVFERTTSESGNENFDYSCEF